MGFKNVFQGLTRLFSDGSPSVALNQQTAPQPNTYNLNGNDILFKTNSKDEYEAKLLQGRQQNLLAKQWRRATNELNNKSLASLNEVQLMYRDTELMDAFPEIGTAMDIFAEESCYIGKTGFMVNINSKSERVKSVLEDLLVNRLQINVTLPMVSRAMCKYGNCFMLLDMNAKSGVVNWKQLPVMEMQRFENGMDNPYSSAYSNLNNIDLSTDVSPKFVWVGQNEFIPYRSWQIGHFRLLYDSQFLPYGCSILNKARRHFRILSMMEDSMLLYRLERSMERRVFKINVGAINPDDVPAYVQEVMNEFKRTPIVDPQTGQLDLRKNILPVHKDTPIPLLDGRTIPIKELAKEYEEGKENFVYSIQDNTLKIVPGKVVWCGKNYTAESLVKITLDDNSHMIMAPEHEIIMRDGSRKRADEVKPGESVMPLYREIDLTAKKALDRYEKVYNPNTDKYQFTHRLIAEDVEKGGECYNTVHNKDFNKYNNSPTNLLKKNHKITSVEIVGGDDVYCMTVVGVHGEEDRHNFALTTWRSDGSYNDSGVFVSNCQQDDYFVPVRDSSEPSPIETLQGAQNLTAMDDIKYIQNKIVTALRIPKQFLNFEETTGDGKNLSLLDVRFMRTVNRIQQALLMELNKICIIHLYMLGFEDDLTNFSLTMNNPSTQAEMMELDNLAKKITTAKDAVSDLGNGMALMSLTRAWREILGWSDKEIADNLEQMRLEAALAIEMQKTSQIIKRTGLFDPVDNVYGEAGADYSEESMEGEGSEGGPGGGGGGFGGGGLGGGFGADMDFGDEEGLEGGAEGEMPMEDAAAEEGEAAQEDEIPPMGEAYLNNLLRKTLNEQKMLKERLLKENIDKQEKYLRKLTEHRNERRNENEPKPVPIFQKSFLINQELNEMVNHMKEISADKVDNPFEG